ncbi:MAG: hypothetical protein H8E78_06820 [Proteobacteria bacterium]|nr:hypothetical protein [Pseudomonadota bacterium]
MSPVIGLILRPDNGRREQAKSLSIARVPDVRSVSMILLAGVIALGFAAQTSAGDQISGLAPPGACAEPREAAVGGVNPNFSVVGSVAALLSPINVALAPPAPAVGLARPVSYGLARPGACDRPASECGVEPAIVSGGNPPIEPGGPPPIPAK